MTKTALITGGSQRIGKAICEKIAENGWNVVIHFNKSKKKAYLLKENLKKLGVKSCCIKANLSNEYELKTLFSRSKRIIGNINCLINNASTFELDNIDTINKKKMELSSKRKCLGSYLFNKRI